MVVDDFFEMEKECKLFDLRTEDDTPIWDLVRMYVYLKYYFPKSDQNHEVQETSVLNYLNFIKGFFKTIYYFLFNKADFFFLPVSRNTDKNGKYFDKASMSAIKAMGRNAFIFELQSVNRKYKYAAANNYIEYIKKLRRNKSELPLSIYTKIEEALIAFFNECKVSHRELNNIYQDYKFDEKYYGKIFKIKKVKKIFITNNGFKKGIFKAAKNLNIPVYELQHGSFEKDHLAYSYPSFVKPKEKILLPDYLLTVGDYWGSYFNVPIKKLSIGNDSFFSKHSSSNDKSILFVSSKIHGKELYLIAKALAFQFPDININFKLHSNEYSDEIFYTHEFKEYKNIRVIKSEIDIQELISKAVIVILISSTVLYEALSQNKKVAIYKKVNYTGLQNIFNLPNVYLFDKADEISEILKRETINNKVNFFKAFDSKSFQEITHCN